MRTYTFLATGFAKALVLSGSIWLAIVIGKLFGAEDLGRFSTAMSAAWLASTIFSRGYPVLLLRYIVRRSDIPHRAHLDNLMRQQYRLSREQLWFAVFVIALLLVLGVISDGEVQLYFLLLLPLALLGAGLQLASVYFRSVARPVASSICQIGILNGVLAVVILVMAFGSPQLSLAEMMAATALLMLVGMVVFIREAARARPGGFAPVEKEPFEVPKIMFNAVLIFFYRNGYPLVFAIFADPQAIGNFRIEERIVMMVTFCFLFFETFMTKRLIKTVQEFESVEDSVRLYGLYFLYLLVPTALVTLGIFGLFSFAAVRAAVGISGDGALFSLMILAAPFYVLLLYNVMVLNMHGKFALISAILIFTVCTSLIASFGLYQTLALDGLRLAYFLTGLAAALASTGVVLLVLRGLRGVMPGPESVG